METKHTSGLWYWSSEYEDSSGGKTWSLIGDGGYGILSCDGIANSPQGLGDIHNAKLIESAPELLKSLNEMIELFDRLVINNIVGPMVGKPTRNRAKELIKKATE